MTPLHTMSREDLEEEVKYWREEHDLTVSRDHLNALRKQFGLTPQQAQLLLVLRAANGKHLTRGQIFDAIWNDAMIDEKIVDVIVSKLRQKLGPQKPRSWAIETVWGRGRMLTPAGISLIDKALGVEAVSE